MNMHSVADQCQQRDCNMTGQHFKQKLPCPQDKAERNRSVPKTTACFGPRNTADEISDATMTGSR